MGTFQGCGESDSPARSRSPRTQRTLTPHNTGRKCRRPHKAVEPLCHIPGTHTMTRQMQLTTLPPRPMPGGQGAWQSFNSSVTQVLRFAIAPGCVNLSLVFYYFLFSSTCSSFLKSQHRLVRFFILSGVSVTILYNFSAFIVMASKLSLHQSS